jgi:membrane protease YdiL (CAAX protease family)
MLSKPVITFTILTFAISWGVFFTALPLGVFEKPIAGKITAFAFMWGPALAALICAWFYDRGQMIETLGLKFKFNKWLIAAWLIPIALCIAASLISLLGPNVHLVTVKEGLANMGQDLGEDAPKFLGLLVFVSAITIGAAINGVLLISEELGWRGYLWSKIIGFGFWKASLFTGVIWGFWHAPLIYMGHNYPGMPILGIFIMVAFTTLMSPLIGYVRLKNGSMWAASLFHGTLNAIAGVSLLVLAGANFPWNGIIGIPGMAVLTLAGLLVFVALRKPNKG